MVGYGIYWLRKGLEIIQTASKIFAKFLNQSFVRAYAAATAGQRSIELGEIIANNPSATLSSILNSSVIGDGLTVRVFSTLPDEGNNIIGSTDITVFSTESVTLAYQRWVQNFVASQQAAGIIRSPRLKKLLESSFSVNWAYSSSFDNLDPERGQ